MSTSVTCIFITSVLRLSVDLGEQRDEAGEIARRLARLGLAQREPAERADFGGQIGFGRRGSPRHARKLGAEAGSGRFSGDIRG
jgi:hypothetical protein